MNDAFQAFLEFLIDLFSALSKFLGFDFDLGGIINPNKPQPDPQPDPDQGGDAPKP